MTHFTEKYLEKLSRFYQKKDKFSVYSHSVDRFIIVNEVSFFETIILSRILSSKAATQTVILDSAISIDSDNCLDYSLFDKGVASTKTRIAPYPIKQIEIPLFINEQSKIYNHHSYDPSIKELQSYAIFSLKVIYAIQISNALRNTFPIGEILEEFGISELSDNLSTKYDYSDSDIGIKKEILKILYLSDNESEALDKIKDVWIDLGKNLTGYRQYFYYYLDILEPSEFQDIHYDKNSFSRRLC